MRREPRSRLRRAGALVALLLAVAPAAASGQAPNPFTPLPPAQTAPPATTTATATTSTTGGTSGVSSTTIYAALAGAIVLILAIGWFIARDARRIAPVAERSAGAPPVNSAERRRRQRARAKAARRQRKRNR
jgi:hypothetical protein